MFVNTVVVNGINIIVDTICWGVQILSLSEMKVGLYEIINENTDMKHYTHPNTDKFRIKSNRSQQIKSV
jgi:hypothetical protein